MGWASVIEIASRQVQVRREKINLLLSVILQFIKFHFLIAIDTLTDKQNARVKKCGGEGIDKTKNLVLSLNLIAHTLNLLR